MASVGHKERIRANPRPGRSPGGKTGNTDNTVKIYAPIAGGTTGISSPFGEPNHGSPPHVHMGIDVPTPVGTACVAPTDGKIGQFAVTTGFGGEGGMIHFIFTHDTGDIKSGTVIGWGHVNKLLVSAGDAVKAGQIIAYSNYLSAPHVHFIQRTDDSDMDGTVDPTPLFLALQKGKTTPTQGGSGASSSGPGGGGASDPMSDAKAAAFATFIEIPGIFDSAESMALRGQKSLMNDQPLLPFIEQLSSASLRQFMSMPNGNFYAFYPDYFGGFGRSAYWEIEDIEIMDGQIQLSDDSLATHVYVVGDIVGMDGVNVFDKIQSGGVVTVFNAFMADFLNGPDESISDTKKKKKKGKTKDSFDPTKPSLKNKNDAIKFLQKYGARPKFEEAPMVRSPVFESFLAYQRFCLMWAQQFRTTFKFTFMPELFPGGIVAFPEHGLQCYIEEVVHTCSYTDGFTTQATLSAPSALKDNRGNPIDPDRAWVHTGMIRAFAMDPNELPNDIGQPHIDKKKKKTK